MVPGPEVVRVSLCSGVNSNPNTAPGDAVTLREFIGSPSVQDAKTCLVSGPPCGVIAVTMQATPDVQTILVDAVYVPAGHPEPATVNCADTLLVIETDAGAPEKFAVMVEGEFN